MITNQLGLFDFSSPRTSTLSPRTTAVGSSNGLSNSGLSSSTGTGIPGPVGSNSVTASVNTPTSSMNGLLGIVNRPDLCYQSIGTLQHYLKQSKTVVDALTKAISSLSDKDSPSFHCLLCKHKGNFLHTRLF